MEKKYYVELGAISFLLGLTILLQKLFLHSFWLEMVYYGILIISLLLIQKRFKNKELDVKTIRNVLCTSWLIGFFIGYGIYYMEFMQFSKPLG